MEWWLNHVGQMAQSVQDYSGYVAEQTFQVGDKIIHNVFGQGRIKSILSDRNAYMIKFEQIETPRIISFRVPIKRA